MGIDIYAEWDGITDAEKEAQITGCSVEHGHVGYTPGPRWNFELLLAACAILLIGAAFLVALW